MTSFLFEKRFLLFNSWEMHFIFCRLTSEDCIIKQEFSKRLQDRNTEDWNSATEGRDTRHLSADEMGAYHLWRPLKTLDLIETSLSGRSIVVSDSPGEVFIAHEWEDDVA